MGELNSDGPGCTGESGMVFYEDSYNDGHHHKGRGSRHRGRSQPAPKPTGKGAGRSGNDRRTGNERRSGGGPVIDNDQGLRALAGLWATSSTQEKARAAQAAVEKEGKELDRQIAEQFKAIRAIIATGNLAPGKDDGSGLFGGSGASGPYA